VLGILDRCGAAAYTASEVSRISSGALEALAAGRPQSGAGEQLSSLCRRMAVRTE